MTADTDDNPPRMPFATRRKLLAAVLALLVPRAALAGCDNAHPLAVLPMQFAFGKLLVGAEAGGLRFRMILDTGAERSVLDEVITEQLRLPRTNVRTAADGVGGSAAPTADAWLDTLRLGPLALHDLTMVVAETGVAEAGSPPVVGTLGTIPLGAFDLDIDIAAQRLMVYAPVGCGAVPPGWDHPAERLALTRLGGLDQVAVTLDGVALRAVIDTGAARSLVFASAARLAGASLAESDPDALKAWGSGGMAMAVQPHEFGNLRLGSARFRRPELMVAAQDFHAIDMLLGLDVLRQRRIFLSRRDGAVWFGRSEP